MESNAREQLAMIADARSSMAERLITPWWYHPALGLLLAAFTLVFSIGNTTARSLAVVFMLAGTTLLAQAYKKMTGVWVSGLSAGRASRWAWALGGTIVVLMVGSLIVTRVTGLTWPAIAISALTAILVVLIGRAFDNAVRAQLKAGA